MITPADSPSSPEHYASVPVSGVNIQAGNDEAGVAAAFASSVAEAGAGVLYPQSPRQAQTEALLMSPPGYQEFDITGGWHDDFPADPTPGD